MLEYEKASEGAGFVVNMKGSIDEQSGPTLTSLHSELSEEKEVTFNLMDIDSINSLGIRTWINFIRGFCEGRKVTLINCSPDVVTQVNMIPQFIASASIESFGALFVCPECDHEQTEVYQVNQGYDDIFKNSESVICSSCGAATELEADADTFFAFLKSA